MCDILFGDITRQEGHLLVLLTHGNKLAGIADIAVLATYSGKNGILNPSELFVKNQRVERIKTSPIKTYMYSQVQG